MAANRNKRSIALDLKHPDGKAVLRRLIPTVDALVSNIRPAGLARLGFSYETCTELNPRLVYAVGHRLRPGRAVGARGRRSTRSSRRRPASPRPWAPTRSPPSSPA